MAPPGDLLEGTSHPRGPGCAAATCAKPWGTEHSEEYFANDLLYDLGLISLPQPLSLYI